MLVIASRGSQLALWQARWVAAQLSAAGQECRIEIIKTTGDKITDVPLAKVGTKGLFTKEIEEALLDGRAHLAVHSLKDLPTELPEGLVLAAIPEREDPRDAMVGRTLANLPLGAKVGTSSLRRAAQLRQLRPDLQVESIRGNLDTRLRKLDDGQYDAIVLAAAGLKRLGLAARMRAVFEPEQMLPCAGQGALGIEVRSDSHGLRAQLAQLTHRPTQLAVEAERAVSRALGGSCSMPLAAHSRWLGGTLVLEAALGHGTSPLAPLLRASVRADVNDRDSARALGERAAEALRDHGASAYLDALEPAPMHAPGPAPDAR